MYRPVRTNEATPDKYHALGIGHAFASAFSIMLLVMALLLPVDNATPLSSTPDTVLTLPKTSDATMQGTPKRGKFIGKTFDAKDLYKAYKEVETEYHTKAFGAEASSKWRLLASRQDVEVSMMEHPSDPDCPYVKMVAVIPTSIQNCWKWLSLSNWPINMPKMDPFYEGVELHGNYDSNGVNMILARKLTKRILAFGKRDMVFLSVSDRPLADGTWVSGSVSVQTPQIPRQEGYTRAFQDSIAFYKPLEGNTKTRLTIVCRIDLNDSSTDGDGGWIPMWIYVKTIGAAGVRSVTSMRDIIIQDNERETELESVQKTLSIESEQARKHQLPRFWKRKVDTHEGESAVVSDAEAKPMKSTAWWKSGHVFWPKERKDHESRNDLPSSLPRKGGFELSLKHLFKRRRQ